MPSQGRVYLERYYMIYAMRDIELFDLFYSKRTPAMFTSTGGKKWFKLAMQQELLSEDINEFLGVGT